MTRSSKLFGLAAAALAGTAIGLIGVATAQNAAPGPFTDAQATAGQNAYNGNCAACHQPNLSGADEALPLAGEAFFRTWGPRTTADLYNFIRASMPYGRGGTLDNKTYADITTFILKGNGAKAGSTAFTGAQAVKLSTIADGKIPDAIAHSRGITRGGGGDDVAAAGTARWGLTQPGDIKNYVPVTDAMMRHPDDADWLMARRNYQGWSFSPLKQIDTGNVKNLQLKWTWAMNEGGASEITPVIHNGVMFLSNTSNTIQALNAKTASCCGRTGSARPRPVPMAACAASHLWRQGVLQQHRRQDLCPGRAHRQDAVGDHHRRSQPQQHRRRHRHQRQGAVGPDQLRPAARRRIIASSAPMT